MPNYGVSPNNQDTSIVGVSFYYTLVAMNHVGGMLKHFINPANLVEGQQGVIELDPYERFIF